MPNCWNKISKGYVPGDTHIWFTRSQFSKRTASWGGSMAECLHTSLYTHAHIY